uniref:Uncharacterized protein n=1 Tax=Anguilla anguilla TaxID=7936 RepID=A0A0E9ULM3_ANGAN
MWVIPLYLRCAVISWLASYRIQYKFHYHVVLMHL